MTGRSGDDRVLRTHPAIWSLFVADDGDRAMAYDGARIRCGREDCEGFTDGLECSKGCGVRIESNQAEREEKWRREMGEQEAERKARRAEVRVRRNARSGSSRP